MNKTILIGRLTRDPIVRYSNGEKPIAVARFTLAVERKYKKNGEEQEADFISCIAYSKLGEVVEKYFKKGMKMALVGRIQTSNYTNDKGEKVYTTNVVAEEIEFVEKKSDNSNSTNNEFMEIPKELEEDLPFN